ncbi:DUF1853 family protein [Parahaliea aestuarii]|nr:DUF1853 family protein [Parahaliea aestuarii]
MPQSDPPALLLKELRHPRVRDLFWACFSAPLMLNEQLPGVSAPVTNTAFTLSTQRQRWLQTLDTNPAPLLEHLEQNAATRLGLYFEALWHFFLAQDSEVDLLAHNLPVREGGRTLGEFDCIYYCHRRQQPVHLELAVKFYLQRRGGSSTWQDWLGPNSRDRLDLKLQRLLEHQSQLSRLPAGRAQLASIGIDDPLPEVEMKGYLFQHFREEGAGPPGFNPGRRLQQWCHHREVEALLAGSGEHHRILPRLQWLAPLFGPDSSASALEAGALLRRLSTHFAGPGSAQLVAAYDHKGIETRRFFVCSDQWPG